MGYQKNKYRREVILRHGQETGLPLFEARQTLSAKESARFAHAPKAVLIANDTKHLSHHALSFDTRALGAKQQAVYGVLEKVAHPDNYEVEDAINISMKNSGLSNEEIAKFLGVAINHVVGRTFELRQYGLVTAAEKRVCNVTGRIVRTWRITSEDERSKFQMQK